MNSLGKVLISCMVILGVNAFASKVFALDFNFTFFGEPGAPGQVSGVIKGLADNATSQPTQLDILSYTGQTDPNPVVFTFPRDSQSGTFAVSNGNIISQSAYLADSTRGFIELNYFNSNAFYNVDSNTFISNNSGFNGVTYTQATAVPWEFSPVQGVALGLPLFIGLRMLKKRRALKKSTREVQQMIRS